MKTIEECFLEAGSTFPFRVQHICWTKNEYFHCVARAPEGDWIGWNSFGTTNTWGNILAEWQLYTELKPKKKLYPYLYWGSVAKFDVRLVYQQSENHAKAYCVNDYKYIGPHPTLEPIEIDDEGDMK